MFGQVPRANNTALIAADTVAAELYAFIGVRESKPGHGGLAKLPSGRFYESATAHPSVQASGLGSKAPVRFWDQGFAGTSAPAGLCGLQFGGECTFLR